MNEPSTKLVRILLLDKKLKINEQKPGSISREYFLPSLYVHRLHRLTTKGFYKQLIRRRRSGEINSSCSFDHERVSIVRDENDQESNEIKQNNNAPHDGGTVRQKIDNQWKS